ncbi:MAG: nucleotidyltransferase family protein [Rhodospirillaceae bacterium]
MSNWKVLSVSLDASIEDAIRAINEGAMQIALVLDPAGRLRGSVTDGDVRRALLQHVALTEPVKDIMNPAPTSVFQGTPRENVVALMNAHRLNQIPVVDCELRVVGIETLHENAAMPCFDNWVFLLAGGFGKRLRPLTNVVPKPMLPVGGKPVLEIIIEKFINQGFRRFYVAVHYMADKIKAHFGDGEKWGANIRYVEEELPLGTAGALALLPEGNDLPMIVMNGDLMTRVNFIDLLHFHKYHQAVATMCGHAHSYQVPFGVVEADGHEVRGIVEKPVYKHFVNAGIYIISPQIINKVPKGIPLDMPDLLQGLIDEDQKVCFFPLHEYWLDIGRIPDLERAKLEFME